MTTQDFEKRIDLTALTVVTGSEMNQLIDTAKPADGKGINIVTDDTALDVPDVPNPDTELEGITPTHWKNYTWVRKPFDETGRIRIYYWNNLAVADATFLKWQEHFSDDDSDVAEEALATANAAAQAVEDLTSTVDAVNSIAVAANTHANTAITDSAEALSKANQAIEDVSGLDGRVTALEEADGAPVVPVVGGGTGATTVSGALQNLGLTRIPLSVFVFRDAKAAGTNGGDFTTGDWRTRTLNESALSLSNLTGYATLNGDNTFDLVSGTWEIEAIVPATQVGRHQSRLYNVTAGATYIAGSSECCDSSVVTTTSSKIVGTFVLVATSKLRIEHKCQNTCAGYGFGIASNFGINEIYTVVKLRYLGNS